MAKKQSSYSLALVLAILLHVLVLGLLFFHFVLPAITQSNNSPVNIINASVVNPSAVPTPHTSMKIQPPVSKPELKQEKLSPSPPLPVLPVEKIEQETTEAQQQAAAAAEALAKQHAQQQAAKEHELAVQRQRAEQAEQRRQEQAKQQLAQQQAEQEKKALRQKQLEQQQAEQKRLAQQKRAALAKQKLMMKQLQAEQQQIVQQQITQEQQQLHAAVMSQQQQGVIDKYKAMIVQAISQNWLVPDNVDKSLSCQLLIQVGPGGVVLDVQIARSSGDAVFDRSAQAAVFKSSPLPVPEDPALFDKFRNLRLTVRPEHVVPG